MSDAPRPRASVSKRLSVLPQLPQAPTSIDPSAVIAKYAVLTGKHPITVGAGVVLHPYSKVISNRGPVAIGEGCIIWEKATVGFDASSSERECPVTLGKHVVVESGAVVEASEVGDGTIIEAKAKAGDGAIIGKHCKLVPFVHLMAGETLPDYTVLLSGNHRQIDRTLQASAEVQELRAKAHEQQLDVLRRLIPSNLAKFQ